MASTTAQWAFKLDNPLSARYIESQTVLQQYPTHVPIILEAAGRIVRDGLTKKKFLVSSKLTLIEFRKQLTKSAER
jgi:hypothetical protein